MLTIDAETVLTDLDVLEEDGVNYDAQLPSLILEYVSSRWGAERGEAILKELFQYIIDTGSATYDQLYRRSLIVNQSAPINPENEAFYVPLIDFDIRFKGEKEKGNKINGAPNEKFGRKNTQITHANMLKTSGG